MKVLWFTNTACMAAKKLGLNSHAGGWLASLDTAMSSYSNIDLHIAFYHSLPIKPFKIGKVNYHPIYRRRSFIAKIFGVLDNNNSLDASDIKKLSDVVNSVSPDIIHIHGTEDNFALISECINIPVLISIQGILGPYREHLFSGIPKSHVNKCWKLDFIYDHSDSRSLAIRAKREAIMLASAKWVMGRTDWDHRVTRLLAPNSVYFHGDELLRSEFTDRSWKLKDECKQPYRIVTIMSGGLYKGMESLLLAAKRISKTQIAPIEWLVIGQTTSSSLVKLATTYTGIHPDNVGVNCIGYKSADEISSILETSDLYCQVSHIENSPNSLCEAMAMGVPCIATFAGGTSSILTDNQEGILVQDGDSYALAGAIKNLLEDKEKACRLGAAAKKRARFRHNPQKIVDQLMIAYNSILGTVL